MNPLCLALETGVGPTSCAVLRGGNILASRVLSDGLKTTEHIQMLVKEVAGAAAIHIRDVQVVAASTGPGSVTGIRAGLSFAKGLASGIRAEPRCVSLLDALTHFMRISEFNGTAIVRSGRETVVRLTNSDPRPTSHRIDELLTLSVEKELGAGGNVVIDSTLVSLIACGARVIPRPLAELIGVAALDPDWTPAPEGEFIAVAP